MHFQLKVVLLPFHFISLFFVSNKIKVTYCGLEGVFLSRSIPVKTGYSQCFWWESWILCGHQSYLCSGYAGSHHLGGWWLLIEKLDLCRMEDMTCSLPSDCHHPTEGAGGSQAAGVEAQRVKPQLALFLVSAGFPSSGAGLCAPKEGPAKASRVCIPTEI